MFFKLEAEENISYNPERTSPTLWCYYGIMFDDLAFAMTDFAWLMGLNGGCVIYLLRALVSSSGLDSRQDMVDREELKS